ncbi:MAG: YtxH domain-containing protein [Trichlorobacter sp.]|jgi:gas vesicle protein|nr:YtxH domain-containing protein [Trichlorobacter sp.]
MARKEDNTATTAVLALTAGAFFGAVVALLLTPTSGRENRRKLGDMQEVAKNKARHYANEARFRTSGGKKTEDLHYDGGDAWI